ncbi:hypothetical protein CDAR_278101 [Caerostris darwini]|uniref:Uncharacterized protein n=1 Tax=Caerostris darwini TaxID=1538125 RepID=A0AAV4S9W6_9ARAC|nr:hypothetical protein CDAR_278101 [Caerostris darwini]
MEKKKEKEREKKKFSDESRFLGYKICIEQNQSRFPFCPTLHPSLTPPPPVRDTSSNIPTPPSSLERGFREGVREAERKKKNNNCSFVEKGDFSCEWESPVFARVESCTAVTSTKFAPERGLRSEKSSSSIF